MSEEEPYKPTAEDALSVMGDAEFIASEGLRILPKGHMAMVLMQMGVPIEAAGTVAEEMSKRIFDAGWTYIHTDQLNLGVADDL